MTRVIILLTALAASLYVPVAISLPIRLPSSRRSTNPSRRHLIERGGPLTEVVQSGVSKVADDLPDALSGVKPISEVTPFVSKPKHRPVVLPPRPKVSPDIELESVDDLMIQLHYQKSAKPKKLSLIPGTPPAAVQATDDLVVRPQANGRISGGGASEVQPSSVQTIEPPSGSRLSDEQEALLDDLFKTERGSAALPNVPQAGRDSVNGLPKWKVEDFEANLADLRKMESEQVSAIRKGMEYRPPSVEQNPRLLEHQPLADPRPGMADDPDIGEYWNANPPDILQGKQQLAPHHDSASTVGETPKAPGAGEVVKYDTTKIVAGTVAAVAVVSAIGGTIAWSKMDPEGFSNVMKSIPMASGKM